MVGELEAESSHKGVMVAVSFLGEQADTIHTISSSHHPQSLIIDKLDSLRLLVDSLLMTVMQNTPYSPTNLLARR